MHRCDQKRGVRKAKIAKSASVWSSGWLLRRLSLNLSLFASTIPFRINHVNYKIMAEGLGVMMKKGLGFGDGV